MSRPSNKPKGEVVHKGTLVDARSHMGTDGDAYVAKGSPCVCLLIFQVFSSCTQISFYPNHNMYVLLGWSICQRFVKASFCAASFFS